MNDLTVLYYTAGRINHAFQLAVWCSLRDESLVWPRPLIIVVTHYETEIGDKNICVGDVPPSIWQCYVNILLAAKAATTPFVACCEDDSLYVPEHFTYRPPLDTFAYNVNRWVLTRRNRQTFYYFRRRTQMAQCIAPRELLIETLEERFAKFPDPVPHAIAKQGWGEPGRYEKNLGLTPRKLMTFRTEQPNVTINHQHGLMGRRAVRSDDLTCEDVPPWGNAKALWSRIVGD